LKGGSLNGYKFAGLGALIASIAFCGILYDGINHT
jgi:hypothetical protein